MERNVPEPPDEDLLREPAAPSEGLVMGRAHTPARPPAAEAAVRMEALTVRTDGERVVLSVEGEITIRCVEPTITLTSAGKPFICGTYFLARSSGVNRIQGGSVRIH